MHYNNTGRGKRVKSMTGYGHGIYGNDDYTVEIEIKSYNNRFLDISYSINPLISSFEGFIDKEIRKIAARGHLDVSVRMKVLQSNTRLLLDESLLKEYSAIYSRIAAETGVKPTFSDYSAIDELIVSERNTDQSIYQEGIEKALSEALLMLKESKDRDGEGTRCDLIRLGKNFSDAVDTVSSKADELEIYLKEVLLRKFQELLGEVGEDNPRFLAEVASLLVKYSINEELSRLKVHIAEYNRLMDETSPVGKQLDFLCQEMNRECNTIASKSQLADINLQVVKMKDNLENIREQIRNIE